MTWANKIACGLLRHWEKRVATGYWVPRPGIGDLFFPSVHHASCAISSPSSRQSIHVLHLMHRKKHSASLPTDGLKTICWRVWSSIAG
jgi:hypothetical protein